MRGFVIAGTHSGCGKTTITLGLMAALKKRGLKVQPFKAGPDFIDTGLHRLVTGRHSRNLDVWMCGEEYVKECFHKYSADADISIIEGVMGMYDGEHSTAKLAGLLNLPVILVVDAYGMAESAGAVVKGFIEYRAAEQQSSRATGVEPFATALLRYCATALINGVIFNRAASDNHFKRLKDSVRDVTVLGYLPRNLDFEIPHRHLGLTVAEETPIAKENIDKLADSVLEHIDVDTLVQRASLSKSGIGVTPPILPLSKGRSKEGLSVLRACRIAVVYDKAFCFYYEDNMDLLKNAGAEIVTFSPLSDSAIPDKADAIYIGGGYPELYAEELAKNKSMIEDIYNWANSGNPIYAECGGLMYLSKGIYDFDRKFFEMAGVFPFETEMKKGKSHLGYREIILKEDCILGKEGDKFKGHEFHYSAIKDRRQNTEHREQNTACHSVLDTESRKGMDSRLRTAGMTEYGIQTRIYFIKENNGHNLPDEGYRFKNTLASYIHIHFGSDSEIARNFLNHIKEQ
ncbi:MAG: cobyrinate a,c-diamide synthase [Nitrospirae bacterium]|nr:cobyrinate a,c-diamide synthase [Nitrospirota bacterium]